MGAHVSMSIGFKIIARRSISRNGCLTFSFKVIKYILHLGNACVTCIIINEKTIPGNGNRTFLSPWVLMVLKKMVSLWKRTRTPPPPNPPSHCKIMLFCHQTINAEQLTVHILEEILIGSGGYFSILLIQKY